jgi:hypothetical protein
MLNPSSKGVVRVKNGAAQGFLVPTGIDKYTSEGLIQSGWLHNVKYAE